MNDAPSTVFRRVEEHAERDADAIALEGGGRAWSYGSLCRDAAGLAGGLMGRGVRPGDRYAVIAGNCPQTALAWLAGSRCGAVPVLLNPNLSGVELGWTLQRFGAALVLTDADHVAVVTQAAGTLAPTPLVIGLDGDPGRFADGVLSDLVRSAATTVPHPDPGATFEIALTSGTTRLPKGVALSHAGEVAHWTAVGQSLGLGPGDCVYVASPLFHSSGIRNATCVMWCLGGRVVIAPRFSASRFWKEAALAGATWSCLVETMLVLLEQRPPEDDLAEGTRLRFVIGGGAPDIVDRVERRFGLRVVHAYGSTETGMPICTPPDLPGEELRDLRGRRPEGNLAGWPIDGCTIRLVNDGTDALDGQRGEIWVRSSLAPVEYVVDDRETRPAYDDGWFPSGDLGIRGPDGELYFLDRLNDIIRRGGENFASREVEAVLAENPGVLRAVVIPVPDPIFIQEAKAIVIGRPDAPTTAGELWAWCDSRLARFKIPRYIEFRDEVPLNASGRVRKDLLRGEPIGGQGATHDRTGSRGSAAPDRPAAR